jgi:hypothetical protein
VCVVVFAGVDYEKIVRLAEKEADIVLWDGGNNDLSFYTSDLHIVVVDPHRPGHELTYHPGEANLRAADVVVMNKIDTADRKNIVLVREHVRQVNPTAQLVEAASPIFVDDPGAIRGKRVLVIEDGPTLTHGEMAYGARASSPRSASAPPRSSIRVRMLSARSSTPIANIRRPATSCPRWATARSRRRSSKRRSTAHRRRWSSSPRRSELQEIGQPTLVDILSAKFGKKK